jgi:hypothetical protein
VPVHDMSTGGALYPKCAGDAVPFHANASGGPLYALGAGGAMPFQANGSGSGSSAFPIGPPIPINPKRDVTPVDLGDIVSLYGVSGTAGVCCAGCGVGPGVPQQLDPRFDMLSEKYPGVLGIAMGVCAGCSPSSASREEKKLMVGFCSWNSTSQCSGSNKQQYLPCSSHRHSLVRFSPCLDL